MIYIMEHSFELDVLWTWKTWHLEWESFDDHSAYWLALGPLHLQFLTTEQEVPCRPLDWQQARSAIAHWIHPHRHATTSAMR